MTAFDPAAATAAWIGRIPPLLLAQAEARTRHETIAFFAGGAVTILAAWLILRSGLLARLRNSIEKEAPRPWLARAAVSGGFMALLLALQFPFELWRTGGAFGAVLQEDVFRLVLGALVLAPALGLIARAPRSWWAWLGAIGAAVVIGFVWGPYALASGAAPLAPLPDGPAKVAVAAVARASGIGDAPVYVSDAPRAMDDVTGLPWAPRITLTSAAIAGPPDLTKAEIAHLASHHRHADQLAFALVVAGLWVAGLLVAARLFDPLARLLGARGVTGPADPTGLPVLAVVAALWLGAATPAAAGFIRWVNVRADAEALAWSHAPDGLAAWLVRGWSGQGVRPGPLAEAVLYTHPPLERRIRAAMAWKAAHQPAG